MSKKVLVATEKPFSPEAVEQLTKVFEAANYDVRLLESYTDTADLLAAVGEVDAMIIRSDKVTAEVLDAAKQLKIVVRAGAGSSAWGGSGVGSGCSGGEGAWSGVSSRVGGSSGAADSFPARASSSSPTNASAVAYRLPGSLSRARDSTVSTPGGRSGREARIGGGGSWICLYSTA